MAQKDTVRIFDFFGTDGIYKRGDVSGFATLEEDLIGNLSTSFSICSSIFLAHRTDELPFFQLFTENGDSWTQLYEASLEIEKIKRTWLYTNGYFKPFADIEPL